MITNYIRYQIRGRDENRSVVDVNHRTVFISSTVSCRIIYTLELARGRTGGTDLFNVTICHPISTLGGWHPDAHRALCSVATAIAAREMSTFSSAKSILFPRHAALLVTNNALRLMSGKVSGI